MIILSPDDLARVEALTARIGQVQAQYAEAERQLAALARQQDHDHRKEHDGSQDHQAALTP